MKSSELLTIPGNKEELRALSNNSQNEELLMISVNNEELGALNDTS